MSRAGVSSRRIALATLLPWALLPCALLLGTLPVSPALAYLQLTPQLEAGITYQTNPRYYSSAAEAINPAGAENVLGTYVDIRAEGVYKTLSDEFVLAPRVRRTDYLKNNEDLNSSDSYVNFSATRTGSRGSIGLATSFQDTAIVNSEFQSGIPDNPDAPPPLNGGTGRYSNTQQTTWDFQPSLNFRLSPRNGFSITGEFTDTTYDQQGPLAGVATGYLDYSYSTVQLALRHSLNPKNSFVIAINGGNFLSTTKVGPFQNSTDSFGITAAYDHAFSETLSVSATAGTKRSAVDVSGITFGFDPLSGFPCTESAACSTSNEGRNFVGNASLRKRAEETTLNFSVGRAVSPTSNGAEQIQDTVRFYVDRNLTPKLTGTVGTYYVKNSSLNVFKRDSQILERVRQDSTYYSIDTRLSWGVTETMSVYGSYSYNSNKYDVVTGGSVSENNNLIFFGVQYRGVGLRR